MIGLKGMVGDEGFCGDDGALITMDNPYHK
jgi:hypothetical protein